MAQIPEFIGLMKWIREVAYPPMKTIYDEMRGLVNATVDPNVETVYLTEDRDYGTPTVDYDKTTGVFKFGIPVGLDGKDGTSLAISLTVALASELASLSASKVGTVAFAEDTTMIYIWTEHNAWSAGIPFAPTSTWTALTDCQNDISNSNNHVVVINAAGSALVTMDKTEFWTALQTQISANTAGVSGLETRMTATENVANAADSRSTINETNFTNLTKSGGRIDQVEVTANNAASLASTANSKADTAINDASLAQTTADQAVTNAATADAKAVAAQNTANSKVGPTDYATQNTGGVIKLYVANGNIYLATS